MNTNFILTVFKRLKSSNVKSSPLNGGGFGGGVNNFNTHTQDIFLVMLFTSCIFGKMPWLCFSITKQTKINAQNCSYLEKNTSFKALWCHIYDGRVWTTVQQTQNIILTKTHSFCPSCANCHEIKRRKM